MPSTSGEWELRLGDLALGRAQSRARFALLKEIWAHLPAWMFLVYGCLLLNCELTNLSPPRGDLAPTVLFPIGVFAVYYAVRAVRRPDGDGRKLLLVTLGLAFGLPILNLAYYRPSPLPEETVRWIYELSNFAWVTLLLVHAIRHNKTVALLCFGVGLFYGACLENGGILLGFFSETHLRTSVPPFVAPVATMVGWSLVLYMAMFVVRGLRSWLPWLRRSPVLSGLAVALAAVLLDFQIDPIATAVRCWVWDPSLPPFFHGVPLVNFVAWVCALFPFAWFVFRYQQRAGISDRDAWTPRQFWVAFASVPAVLALAAVIFLAAMAVLEGPRGPSYEILFRTFSRALGGWVA